MGHAHKWLRSLLLLLPLVGGPACGQTPTIVPVRSMERPRDLDFICLQDVGGRFEGVAFERCAVDPSSGDPLEDNLAAAAGRPAKSYRLHAVVTQMSRGELAVVDLARFPRDIDGYGLVKVDPRVPGYTFLPVGAVPSDVATDPGGKAVFVASGRDRRVDIVPSGMLRGPIETEYSSGAALPWSALTFSESEGSPSQVAVVREAIDPADAGKPSDQLPGRLYVLLAEATGGPKLKVYDITATPLAPALVGEMTLSLDKATQLVNPPFDCGTGGDPTNPTPPWWIAYDACDVGCPTPCAAGQVCRDKTCVSYAPPLPPAAATSPRMHLAGITVAGGRLYAADDAAPFIHVFDISAGRGAEVRRIALGAPTSRLSVSPPVPDETTLRNYPALELCDVKGWFGDGKDHSTEDPVVKARLNGRCKAHRYVYAVDLNNATGGDGSIAVVDVQVTFGRDDKGNVVSETPDLDGASLVHPMACDSPSLSSSRIPTGAFGLGGTLAVPARAIAFATWDPVAPSDSKTTGARCRPWGNYSEVDSKDGADADAAIPEARRAAGASFAPFVDPRRMRGTFAFAVLASGAVVAIDLDDRDASCRGPAFRCDAEGKNCVLTPAKFPFGSATALGANATGEFTTRAARRHHPRSNRFFGGDALPGVTTITLNGPTGSLPTNPDEPTPLNPHLVRLVAIDTGTDKAPQVRVSGDNPWALSSENWTVTYEGILPGFGGTAGSFQTATADNDTLLDPGGIFCRRGVEGDPTTIDANDIVQIVDDVCPAETCGKKTHDECEAYYGLSTEEPLRFERDLEVATVAGDRVTIAQHFKTAAGGVREVAGKGSPPNVKKCFPGLTRYVVRVNKQWLVLGSASGYLHRRKPGPTEQSFCVADSSKPRVHGGRLRELDRKATPPKAEDGCALFKNPSWTFAIRAGSAPSQRNMMFAFGTQFSFTPLYTGGGSLPTAIRPIALYRGTTELMGWNMLGVVDAIDRGLVVFSVNDFTNGKVVN